LTGSILLTSLLEKNDFSGTEGYIFEKFEERLLFLSIDADI